MGHNISALVCRPSPRLDSLAEFGLPVIPAGDFVVIPMDPHHDDAWTERLGLEYGEELSEVLIDGPFAHYVAGIAADGDYVLLETNYFGGTGYQVAAVFRIGDPTPRFASAQVSEGAINEALRRIGVQAREGADEFVTIGLGKYGDFMDFFSDYYR